MDPIAQYVSTLGFPIVVALFVLIRVDRRMSRLEERLTEIAILLAASLPPEVAQKARELIGANGAKKRRA